MSNIYLKKNGVKSVRIIVVLILSFAALPGHASAIQDGYSPVEDMEHLLGRLNTNAATIESIQSHFIQKKQLEFLDETIVSKGAFWFKKENKLRWAYNEPFDYVIVINDGSFSIKDGEKVSAYDIDSNPAFAEINNLIVDMVRGNITEDKFEMTAFENLQYYLMKLVPRDAAMREVISSMNIYFSKSDLTVREVVMKESEKDYTVITFTDKQINEPIEDMVFSVDY